MPTIIEKRPITSEEIEKRLNYIELKINLLMEETESKTQEKWDEKKQEVVPKTVLEVWQDRSKKELAQQKYSRRESFRNNDKNI